MIAIRVEKSRQSKLGVLEHAEGVEVNIEPALAALRKSGLSDIDPGLRNAVAVALMHSSYLYETQTALPQITDGVLRALSTLGGAFLRKLAMVDAYKRTPRPTAESLSKDVSQVAFSLTAWSARQAWLLESAAVGNNFSDTTPPAKLLAHLCHQLLGVLCLANEEMVASRLLEDLLSNARSQRSTVAHDPKTTLQEVIAPDTAEYTYEREGPDHDTVFRATVKDKLGHYGSGLGRSKKQAAQNAALDLLMAHFPHALSTRTRETAPPVTPDAIPIPREHAVAVRELQILFGLPISAAPLLSQALIHSSWGYGYRAKIDRYRQQDNRTLAFVGAMAVGYEDALAAICQVASDPPQEFAFRGLDNSAFSRLFHQTGLVSGLLLGTGQASVPITEEMGATAFQAIIGAVFVSEGFPNSLAACWPKAWASIWEVIAQIRPRAIDPTTLVQETACEVPEVCVACELRR